MKPTNQHQLTLDVNSVLRWCLCLTVVGFVSYKWIKRKRTMSELRKLDGPKPSFFLGNLKEAIKLYGKKSLPLPHGVYLMERIMGSAVIYAKKGMYLFWFAFDPVVSISKPDAFEAVLGSSTSLDKSWEYRFLHPWLGLGLLTSTGSKWRTRRRILTPSFHFRILEDFIPVFNEQSLILVRKLQEMSEQEFVDISPLVTLCTLDIVSESVMGVHIGAQRNSNSEYVQAIHSLGDYFNHRTARPWLWPDFLFYISKDGKKFKDNVEILHSFTRQVIRERKQSILQNEGKNADQGQEVKDVQMGYRKRKAFMDLLLDLHIKEQLLSEEDIREEVDTFMFEGHDTTAMGISFALYCIGLYPEIQEKMFEELDSIFAGDNERPVTHDDIREMKYLECVLKESQRVYPSVPLIGRVLHEDTTIDGIKLPRGLVMHLNILALHRHPEVYPNPEVFDPDRFLSENSLNRHPYAFVPFSAGPRNCIGQKFALMEEKVVISNILRHFKVHSLDPRDRMYVKIEFVLRSALPLRLKFTPRRRTTAS